ncbi:Hypp6106 [Branchiostoma lanceolatum]|uniref:Hypp6106 protein n=1 Tax=Branchiostoma lanceolatum TaxID=7740 RepID=A0A8J9YNN9_BRALA|nr:Hypp6106 [Branchiostoma lanceolatum]
MELEKKIDSLQQSKQILKNKKSGPKPTEQDGSNNPSASTSLSQANGLSASPSLDGPLAGLRDGRAGDPLAGLRDREAGDPLAELRHREVGDPLAELRDREAGDPLAELRDREMGDPLAELRDREAGDPLAELRDREVGDPLAELRDREAGDPLAELRDREADDPLAELWDRQAGGGSPAKGPSPVPAMAKKRKRVSPVPAVAERRKRLTTPHNNAPQKGNVWEYGTYPPEPLKTDQYIAVAFKDTYYVGKVTSVHGKTAEIKYLAYNGCGMYSPTKKAPDKTKDKYVLAVDLSFKQMTEGKIVLGGSGGTPSTSAQAQTSAAGSSHSGGGVTQTTGVTGGAAQTSGSAGGTAQTTGAAGSGVGTRAATTAAAAGAPASSAAPVSRQDIFEFRELNSRGGMSAKGWATVTRKAGR